MKNKTTAAVLAFFLGGLGIHRFYLGQGGLGILYIILTFAFGLSLLLSFIDFIIFLTMSTESFDAKYNSKVKPAHSIDDLSKLSDLKDKGLVTDEEFEKKKKEILG